MSTAKSNPFDDGHAAGLKGRKSPHPPTDSRDYTRWLCGYNAAQAELRRDAQRTSTMQKQEATQ